jgi:hypothetical protein
MRFFLKLVRPARLLGAARLALRVALAGDRRRDGGVEPLFLCRGFDPLTLNTQSIHGIFLLK